MQEVCDETLARAGLTGEQDGGIAVGENLDLTGELPHGGRATERVSGPGVSLSLGKEPVAPPQVHFLERTLRGDVQEGIDTAYYAASEGRRLFGHTVPSELKDKWAMSYRRPIGVCGLITPFNFPMAIPTWKAFPALVCGNSLILKPAEEVPHTATILIEILLEAGLPPDVVQLVHGFGEEVGSAMVEHPQIPAISFTGSTETGSLIGETCGRMHKRLSLEMGGKNAQIVMSDADLEPLAVAKRQRVRPGVENLLEVEPFRQRGDPRRDPRLRHLEQPGVQFKVLPDGQFAIQREQLRHVADVAAGLDVMRIDRLAEEPGGTLAGRQEPGQHLHHRGLAAAVGAEKAKNLPPADAEADILHGDKVAEAQHQILRFDGDVVLIDIQRRDGHRRVTTLALLWQQRHEGVLQGRTGGLLHEFGRGAGGQYLAGVHGHQPVKALGFVHIGGGDHHAHPRALLANAVNQLPELSPRQRVDPGGRLIKDQQVRIVDQ